MLARDLIDRFHAWNAEHRSPATCKLYRGRLRLLRTMHGEREWDTLRPPDVDDWLRAAGRRPDGTLLASDTRRANVVAFERLQAWAVDQEYVERTVTKPGKLEKPRARHRERVLTADEIAAVLRHATPEFGLIVQAFLQCGARPNELARATLADLDRDAGVIVLREHKTAKKTGRPRVIPCGERMLALLDRAIGERTDGPIFLDHRGRQWTPDLLSRTFRRIRKAAGLPGDVVLYSTRHTHATELLRTGGDLKAAADALGHSSVTMTQRYCHPSVRQLRAQQDRLGFGTQPEGSDDGDGAA